MEFTKEAQDKRIAKIAGYLKERGMSIRLQYSPFSEVGLYDQGSRYHRITTHCGKGYVFFFNEDETFQVY